MLIPQPVKALESLKAWWARSPRDLSQEIQSLRELLAQRDHPDFKSWNPAIDDPPGSWLFWYFEEYTKLNEALFAVPARCADDVLRKYAMLEEAGWRNFANSKTRFPKGRKKHNQIFGHWYAQLEEDCQMFKVNINPWWQEETPPYTMINDKRVEWTDGHWELYETPKEILALLEKLKRQRTL